MCRQDGHTWSIIVADSHTREIGVAGASCTFDCRGICSILPGKGAIVVQARSNTDARDKGLELMDRGATPKQILDAIRKPFFNPEKQQYAILTLNQLNAAVTYTGKQTRFHKKALTAEGIAAQGNTLGSRHVIPAMMEAASAARKRKLPLAEVLMDALEAGSEAGGDKRCGEQRATSAFLTVARPDDHPERFFLDLQITGEKIGGSNAVSLLRTKFGLFQSGKSE
ncbi:MAG: DUF1028 domain-containing protein [Solitalea sp.]